MKQIIFASGVMLGLAAIAVGCSRADQAVKAPPATSPAPLVIANPVEHVGLRAREPMVVEHPDGTLFLAGYGEPVPTLWTSPDQGATWTSVNVGTAAAGAIGNSDVDLAIAPNGTLYFVAMVYDRKANEGTHISIGVSKDVGATWSWTLLSKTRFDDRPWVEVAPDGTPHVIWNDGGGVCHAVSRDHGITWTELARINPEGGSSHLAIGPNGEIAVRLIPLSASGNKIHRGVDLVAVSSDGGNTWQKHAAPGQRDWIFPLSDDDPLPRWVEPIAWDARGDLYSLWSNPQGLWLARSDDHGAKWTSWRVVEGKDVMYFPYLAARGPGELAATWFSGPIATLQAHVARFDASVRDVAPRVTEAPPFRPDSWRPVRASDTVPPARDPAGEYLPVMFLKRGGLAVVSPIQDEAAKRVGFSWWKIDQAAHR
ncbi:MAG: sialidase family protein [Vicinamibacterales bacterium]